MAAIAGIGEVTLEKKEQIFAVQAQYEALTEIQKKLVTDYNVLVQAIRRYQNLVAVQPVIRQIHELGGVESITLESGTAIMAAINMYNALTGEQQELVTNYDVLEMLIRVYDSKAAIDRVTRLIDSIGAVSSASGSQIQEARAAYDALTLDEQKQMEPVGAGACGSSICGIDTEWRKCTPGNRRRKSGDTGEPAKRRQYVRTQ